LLSREGVLKDFHYGGQGVIEGVMMRGRKSITVAVRDPSGEIVLHSEPLSGGIYDSVWRKIPFVRGLLILWDTLVLGTRSLMYSANVALSEEEVEFTTPAILATVAFSLAFAIVVFFLVPLLLVGFLDRFIASDLLSNLVEGLIRLSFLLLYVFLIGLVPDIRRVFAYHGAEHKTINAFENGASLDAEGVSVHSTAHTRCGTGFLLIVVVLSVLIFAFLGRPPMVWRVISRVLLIPIIAGISYEFIRFAAAHSNNPFVRAFIVPSMALQTLTTREPDEPMLEVAIAALKPVLATDGVPEGEE
jgi:uncharacterized protein YqhQ